MLQRDAPQLRPRWTVLALLVLGAWGLGVSLNSAIQNSRNFFACAMPYPELETEQMCILGRGTMFTACISTASVSTQSSVGTPPLSMHVVTRHAAGVICREKKPRAQAIITFTSRCS